jgi:hypothetical protein
MNASHLYLCYSDIKISGFEEDEVIYKEKARSLILAGLDEALEIEKLKALALDHFIKKIKFIEETTHMPFEAIVSYLKVASEKDVVISFRDPGMPSMHKLKQGATGKPYSEKAKSSRFGKSLSGYIPINQEFSKASEKSQITFYNKKLKRRILDSLDEIKKLRTIIYRLNLREYEFNLKNISEFISSKELVTPVDLLDKQGRQIYGIIGCDNSPVLNKISGEPIFLIKDYNSKYIDEDTLKEFNLTQKHKLIAIKVLATVIGLERIDGKLDFKIQKITSDHDLLFISTKSARGDVILEKEITDKFGEQDKILIELSSSLMQETIKMGAVKHATDSGGGSHENSLADDDYKILGDYFLSERSLLEILNNKIIHKLLRKKIGGNPFPEEFEKKNLKQNYSFIIPNKNKQILPEIRIANSLEEMVVILNEIKQIGYSTSINAMYGILLNENSYYQIDESRVSSQEFLNYISKLKSKMRKDIADKMERESLDIYKLLQVKGMVKLQYHSKNKCSLVELLENRIYLENIRFFKNYNNHSPAIMAIKDKKIRNSQILDVESPLGI